MVEAMLLLQTRVMVLHLIVMVLLLPAMGLMQHIPAQNLLQLSAKISMKLSAIHLYLVGLHIEKYETKIRVQEEIKWPTLVGDDGVSGGLPVTQCNQELRQICAEDKCKIVEGDPECFEKTVENVVKVPEETCSMEPNTECRNVTIRWPFPKYFCQHFS